MFVSGSQVRKRHYAASHAKRSYKKVFKKNNVPEGVCCLVTGGREVGEWMSSDKRIPLVSATGSTRMGRAVGAAVKPKRMGRSLLELGKQRHHHLTACRSPDSHDSRNLGAVGTAGQRCTTAGSSFTKRSTIHSKKNWYTHINN